MNSKHVPASRKRAANEAANPRPPKKLDTKSSKHSQTPGSKPVQRRGRAAFTKNHLPQTKLQVYVFGEGSAGELGLGVKNAVNVKAPRVNPNLAGVVTIATGGMHAAAITTNNKILTWGASEQGMLARDVTWDGGLRDVDDEGSESEEGSDSELNPKESAPSDVSNANFPEGTVFTQVAAGDTTTFALTSDGCVYGWGIFRDHAGEYGFTFDSTLKDPIVEKQLTPLLIPGLKKITQLSVGADFALALDVQGRVFAWGCGEQNELGRRLVERRRPQALLPSLVNLPKRIKIVSIHTGANHAFAIDSNGDTWTWGSNNFGQTGFGIGAGEGGATVCGPQKVPLLEGRRMKIIDGGLHHSIGLTQAGECLVWGRMDGSQTGLDISQLPLDDPTKVVLDSRKRPRILLQPTKVPIPPCVHVAAGSDHSIAVTSDGKAYSWGFNASHQCGQGGDDDEVKLATLMQGKQIRDQKIVWAGAGGQYGMLASVLKEN